MDRLQKLMKHKDEEKAIFDALRQQPELPGMADTDAIFLMQLDVPDAVLKKLRTH